MLPTRILVAVDGSEHGERALGWAAGLAQCHDVPLTILHVVPSGGGSRVPKELEEYARIEHVVITEEDLLRRAGKRIVEAAAQQAAAAGAPQVETAVLVGSPARTIVATARDRGADLVVLGSRGLSDLPGLLLGSVSHKVVHAMEEGAVLIAR